jgi:hypothetical protein
MVATVVIFHDHITPHDITLHHITPHDITLHHITHHDITLHHITLSHTTHPCPVLAPLQTSEARATSSERQVAELSGRLAAVEETLSQAEAEVRMGVQPRQGHKSSN